jgi:hypothetical protein
MLVAPVGVDLQCVMTRAGVLVVALAASFAGTAGTVVADAKPGTVGSAASGPPLPKILSARIVTGTRYGTAVRVSYCFSALPTASTRKPWRLHLTVDNLGDGFPPLSHGWLVTRRCQTVIHPVGGIKPPYVLRYSVETRVGTWSKQGLRRIT